MLLSLIFLSCGEEKYGVLPFEGRDAQAICEVNEKFTVEICREGEVCTLTVIAPSEIEGVVFSFSDKGDCMMLDNTAVPVSRENMQGIYALASVFNINEAMMTSASSIDGTGMLCFIREDTEYTLQFDREGDITGAKIIGEGYEYTLEFSLLQIK